MEITKIIYKVVNIDVTKSSLKKPRGYRIFYLIFWELASKSFGKMLRLTAKVTYETIVYLH